MNPTVTKAEVRLALEEFEAQGVTSPGLHRLQKHIGHGSLPRIKRFVGEIKGERIARFIPGAKPMPDEVTAKISEIWTCFEEAINEQEAELEDRISTEQLALEGERQQFKDSLGALQLELDTLQAAHASTQRENEDLKLQLHESKKELAEAAATLHGKEALIHAIETSKQDAVSQMVKAEQQATQREHQLNQKIEQASVDRLEMERRFQEERESTGKSLSDLRDIVAFQRTEMERYRATHQQAADDYASTLASNAQHTAKLQEMLELAQEESAALNAENISSEKEIARLHATITELSAQVEKPIRPN
jgi:chromosome segregation ATPase